MLGILSRYPIPLRPTIGAAVAFTLVAAVAGIRAQLARRPSIAPVARVLAVGATVVTVIATASPHAWPYRWEGFGDLALGLGRGGLSDWRVVFNNASSLAALLLIANVGLYIGIAFFAAIGWRSRSWGILAACIGLSLLVEAFQYLLLERVASTDDFLLNTTGAVLGLSLGTIVRSRLAGQRA